MQQAWGMPGPGEAIIDVGRQARRKAARGAVVSLVVGLVAIFAASSGQVVGGGTWLRVVVALVGAAFLVPPVLIGLRWRSVSRPRQLVIGPAGVRLDDPQGAPFALAWGELGAVALSRTTTRVGYTQRSALVRLDLFPADPGFRARHPELEPLWELDRVRAGYRLPLGQAPELIGPLDAALRGFGGARYRGVQDQRLALGLR